MPTTSADAGHRERLLPMGFGARQPLVLAEYAPPRTRTTPAAARSGCGTRTPPSGAGRTCAPSPTSTASAPATRGWVRTRPRSGSWPAPPTRTARPPPGCARPPSVGPTPLTETFDLSQSTGADWTTGRGVAGWKLDLGDGSTLATGVGNPTSVAHTYPAGTWTATLTVRGGTGGLSRTTRTTVTSAGPPTISEGEARSVTATSASLPGWIGTFGLAGAYQVQWGTSATFGNPDINGTLSPIAMVQARTEILGGLAPGTRYYWRYVATTAAGTTYGPTRWFTTGL